MTVFYERFEGLCKERGLRPQSAEITRDLGISSPAIYKWKTQDSIPNGTILSSLSSYFGVSVDYLLGLTEVRNIGQELDGTEAAIISVYRSCSGEDRLRIAQFCMNLKDEKGMQENVG